MVFEKMLSKLFYGLFGDSIWEKLEYGLSSWLGCGIKESLIFYIFNYKFIWKKVVVKSI